MEGLIQVKADLSRSFRAAYGVLQSTERLEEVEREGQAQDTVRLAGHAIEACMTIYLCEYSPTLRNRENKISRLHFPQLLDEVQLTLSKPIPEAMNDQLSEHRRLRNALVHPRARRRVVPSLEQVATTVELALSLVNHLYPSEDWAEQERLQRRALRGETIETLLELSLEDLALERLKRLTAIRREQDAKSEAATGDIAGGLEQADQWSRIVAYYTDCLRKEAAQAFALDRSESNWQEQCYLLIEGEEETFLSQETEYLVVSNPHNVQALPSFLTEGYSQNERYDLCYAFPFYVTNRGGIVPITFTRVVPDMVGERIALRREDEGFEINTSVLQPQDQGAEREEIQGTLEWLDAEWQEQQDSVDRFRFYMGRIVNILANNGAYVQKTVSENLQLERLPRNTVIMAPLLIKVRPGPTSSLIQELEQLADPALWDQVPLGLGHIMSQRGGYDYPLVHEGTWLPLVAPATERQMQAVLAAEKCPLTVVTGPPGTGKSQLILNLVTYAALNGKTVLFASKNNQAVNVVMEKLDREVRYYGAIRTGSMRQGHRKRAAQELDNRFGLLSSTYSSTGAERLEAQLSEVESRREQLLGKLERRRTIESLLAEREDEYRALHTAMDGQWQALAEMDVSSLGDGVLEKCRSRVRAVLSEALRLETGQLDGRERIVSIVSKQRIERTFLEGASKEKQAIASLLQADLPDMMATNPGEAAAYLAQIERLLDVFEIHGSIATLRDELGSIESAERIHIQLDQSKGEGIAVVQNLLQERWKLSQAQLEPDEGRRIMDYVRAMTELTSGQKLTGWAIAMARQREKDNFPAALKVFPIWATTNLSARQNLPLVPGLFDFVVIDEASQCDIASALPLLYRGKHAVIIGDNRQLRHVSTLDEEADREAWRKQDLDSLDTIFGYSRQSLFDLARRAVSTQPGPILLNVHFRSHRDIIQFSNRAFYGEQLQIATIMDRFPETFRDTAGGLYWWNVSGMTHRTRDGQNTNTPEVNAISSFLPELINTVLKGGWSDCQIGVVTPFTPQKELLASAVDVMAARHQWPAGLVRVGTVHTYQGDERDFMILSPVVSRGAWPGTVRWLSGNRNLINVALTRARLGLFVVGDLETCRQAADYLEELAKHVRDRDAVVDDWRRLPLFKAGKH